MPRVRAARADSMTRVPVKKGARRSSRSSASSMRALARMPAVMGAPSAMAVRSGSMRRRTEAMACRMRASLSRWARRWAAISAPAASEAAVLAVISIDIRAVRYQMRSVENCPDPRAKILAGLWPVLSVHTPITTMMRTRPAQAWRGRSRAIRPQHSVVPAPMHHEV